MSCNVVQKQGLSSMGQVQKMCLGLETYNMFNCDKVKNNEIQGNLFFTPMSRSGAFFLHLPHGNFFGSEGIKMITHYIMVKIPFI